MRKQEGSDVAEMRRSDRSPLFLFLGLILFPWMASRMTGILPRCGLRKWAGIPCPFCGGTHSLIAWSHMEWREAFHLNPMVCLACVMVVVWFVFWIVETWLRWPWISVSRRWIQQMPRRLVLSGIILLNWIYLCWVML